MAINTALLVSAPVLQDVIIDDATGEPLANGQIFLFQDNSRTTFKNWYYQSGAPNNYTYITLPNPLTLNAAGAITDPNGNDTIPFFYPYSETDNTTPQPYYIQVFNSNGQQKFVRQNFPFNPVEIAPVSNNTLKNYILNNGFWRNLGSQNTGTLTSNALYGLSPALFSVVVAPGAHDGFSMPDMIYFRNTASGSTETITFTKFANGSFLNPSIVTNPNQDVTPEYYMNLNVTGAGSETSRYLQIPVQLHIKNLESTQAVFTIWAQNVSSNPSNQISIALLQFLGTGAAAATPKTLFTATLTNAWQKIEIPFIFTTAVGTNVSNAGDDAWYIQIIYPAGVGITPNINIAKPSLYIGTEVPSNDFTIYDEVTPIINGFRTGDIRQGMNNFIPYGWVALNNGSIGSPTSSATNRAATDTWPLYNLLWNNINNAFAPVATGRSGSAFTDFNMNKAMTLTSALGNALVGNPITFSATYNRATTPVWHQADYSNNTGSVAGLFTISSNTFLYVGAPVFLTGTMPTGGNFVANTVYYAIPDPTNALGSGTTFQLASSYNNALFLNAIAAGGASDNGSNIVLNFALGGNFGQGTHLPQIAELVTHNHTYSIANGAAGATYAGGATFTNATTGTSSTGDTNYFNLIQPSLYTNVFIKL